MPNFAYFFYRFQVSLPLKSAHTAAALPSRFESDTQPTSFSLPPSLPPPPPTAGDAGCLDQICQSFFEKRKGGERRKEGVRR